MKSEKKDSISDAIELLKFFPKDAKVPEEEFEKMKKRQKWEEDSKKSKIIINAVVI